MRREEVSRLRARLEQRLAIGGEHLEIGDLDRPGLRHRAALAEVRGTLMPLAEGGPFTRWFDANSAADALELDAVPPRPVELVHAICDAVGAGAQHLEAVDDDLERFLGRMAVNLRERAGVTVPRVTDTNVIWCRHFATTVSRAYGELAHGVPGLEDTAVLIVIGLPQCDGASTSLHAWNWLVDFRRGTVAAFEPQASRVPRGYAGVSPLLYTFACWRRLGGAIPSLRPFVRPHATVHGATVLFHLARHPIDRASRREIVARLRASQFARVVPDWEAELEASPWRDWEGVFVGDVVGYADG